jgi:integrative and conjugative element protein (TIGR02256 family)
MRRPTAIWIRLEDVERLRAVATAAVPLETGGVLLGYRGETGDAVVTHVIDGGPSAKRTRTTFEPDYEHQDREIAKAYKESGRRLSYLGDWHSHPPGGGSTLSGTDRRTLKMIARHRAARSTDPIMILVHFSFDGEGELAGFRLRSLSRFDLRIIEVPVITVTSKLMGEISYS